MFLFSLHQVKNKYQKILKILKSHNRSDPREVSTLANGKSGKVNIQGTT